MKRQGPIYAFFSETSSSPDPRSPAGGPTRGDKGAAPRRAGWGRGSRAGAFRAAARTSRRRGPARPPARPLRRPPPVPTYGGRRSPGGVRDVPDEQGGVGGPRVARHGRSLRTLGSGSLFRRRHSHSDGPSARPPPLGSAASAQPQRRARRGRCGRERGARTAGAGGFGRWGDGASAGAAAGPRGFASAPALAVFRPLVSSFLTRAGSPSSASVSILTHDSPRGDTQMFSERLLWGRLC